MYSPSKLEKLLESLGHERKIHYALDSFQRALKAVGHPEKNVKSVVIAGTNGKGSVTWLTTEVLKAHGLKVATYMSPHLKSVTERFLLNGQEASVETLVPLAETLLPIAKENTLSYFEFLTLLFFVWAKKENAEVLVLEVGLGGRLDATNVTTPLACALTNIDFDHMAYLGNSLEAILKEKLGVVPRGGTLVSGLDSLSLTQLAQTHCDGLGAKYIPLSFAIQATGKRDWESQELELEGTLFSLQHPGQKWIRNANTAFELIKAAFPDISFNTIREAFKRTRFPGRFETVQRNPRVILSGDHNPAGVRALIETIKSLPPTPIKILCAFSPDKPREEMLNLLKEVSSDITETSLTDPGQDFERLLKNTKKEEILLVTGSLYLVGALKKGFRL